MAISILNQNWGLGHPLSPALSTVNLELRLRVCVCNVRKRTRKKKVRSVCYWKKKKWCRDDKKGLQGLRLWGEGGKYNLKLQTGSAHGILPMFHISPIKRNAASETLRPFLTQHRTERGRRGKWQICKSEAGLLSVGRRGGLCAKNSVCSRLDISFSKAFRLAI